MLYSRIYEKDVEIHIIAIMPCYRYYLGPEMKIGCIFKDITHIPKGSMFFCYNKVYSKRRNDQHFPSKSFVRYLR